MLYLFFKLGISEYQPCTCCLLMHFLRWVFLQSKYLDFPAWSVIKICFPLFIFFSSLEIFFITWNLLSLHVVKITGLCERVLNRVARSFCIHLVKLWHHEQFNNNYITLASFSSWFFPYIWQIFYNCSPISLNWPLKKKCMFSVTIWSLKVSYIMGQRSYICSNKEHQCQ